MTEYDGSISQLREIIRQEDPDVRAILAITLFRIGVYSRAKGLIADIARVEEQIIGRAAELLPEINRVLGFGSSGMDAKAIAHLILMTALEWSIDQHLVANPPVPSGFLKEAQEHIKAVIAARNFLFSRPAAGWLFLAVSALDFTETAASEELWYRNEHLKEIGALLNGSIGTMEGASLVFSVAADLLALTRTAGEMEMPDDRRRSPKRNLADRCIALAQLAGRPAISTAPNSDFLTLVSLVFEIASGERHASLGHAVRTAWSAVRAGGGKHRVMRSTADETSGVETDPSSEAGRLDFIPRRTAGLLRATLEHVPLSDWEREPLFVAYVASLRRISRRIEAENIELQFAESLLAKQLLPTKL